MDVKKFELNIGKLVCFLFLLSFITGCYVKKEGKTSGPDDSRTARDRRPSPRGGDSNVERGNSSGAPSEKQQAQQRTGNGTAGKSNSRTNEMSGKQSGQKRDRSNQRSGDRTRGISMHEKYRLQKPVLIAHRGAPAHYPELTLPSMRRALEEGIDFLEIDVVPTKDGRLILRHENELSITTDVKQHEEFQDRKREKTVNGVTVSGWFSEDFTLSEVRQLRAKERLPEVRESNTRYDGKFKVPTLREVIQLVQKHEEETGRKVGLYIEPKHPTYFREIGEHMDGSKIDMKPGKMVVEELVNQGFTASNRVYLQSFEVRPLLDLRNNIMPEHDVEYRLVQLIGDITRSFYLPVSSFSVPFDLIYHALQEDFDRKKARTLYGETLVDLVTIDDSLHYGHLMQPNVLKEYISSYADGIGVWKDNILLRDALLEPVDVDGDGNPQVEYELTGETLPIVKAAHYADLFVHVYTIRRERSFLALKPEKQEKSEDGNGVDLSTNDGADENLDQMTGKQLEEQEREKKEPESTKDREVLSASEEMRILLERGVDGIFTDHPGFGVRIRNQYWQEVQRSGSSSGQ